MWGQGKTIFATKTQLAFNIYDQPFDQTVNVNGSGTFNFKALTYKTKYGVINNIATGVMD